MSGNTEPQLPPGFAKDLVDLLHSLWLQAGQPTRKSIAARAGLAQSHVSTVLGGKRLPSPEAAEAIARSLRAVDHVIARAGFLAEEARRERQRARVGNSAADTRPGDGEPGAGLLATAAAAVAAEFARLAEGAAGGSPAAVDPVRAALEITIGRAITQYVTQDGRLDIAAPLLTGPGLIADVSVAAQFAAVLARADAADATLVGQRWREALADPPATRDFGEEAMILLQSFRDEIKLADPLAPAAEGRAGGGSAGAGSGMTGASLAEEAAEVRREVAGIAGLLPGRWPALPAGLRLHFYDRTGLIAERTRDFTGREFVFRQIRDLIESADHAYCHVLAYPGVGKTALMAKLVKDDGYVHHFNSRTAGVVSPAAFLGNVCVQLIARYGVALDTLPPRATQDGSFLAELLADIAARKKHGKLVVAVDALDESDIAARLPGTNPLFLPETLPDGVVFLVASRPGHGKLPPAIRVHCEQKVIFIDHHSDENMADIVAYLGQQLNRRGIARYLEQRHLSGDTFAADLAERSAGNFMYLHHMLPELEKGAFDERAPETLPLGLEQYYSDHLERMRGTGEDAWFRYKLPVIAALSAAGEPLTIRRIAAIAKVGDPARVAAAVASWGAFLEPVAVTEGGTRLRAYRIYHASFQEFLHGQTTGDAAAEARSQVEQSEEEIITAYTDMYGEDD